MPSTEDFTPFSSASTSTSSPSSHSIRFPSPLADRTNVWPSTPRRPSSSSLSNISPTKHLCHNPSTPASPSAPPTTFFTQAERPPTHVDLSTPLLLGLDPPSDSPRQTTDSAPHSSSARCRTIVPEVIALSSGPTSRRSTRTKTKHPSYAKQRTQQSIRTINATYAVCQGKVLDSEASKLAYPVHKVSNNRFLVPATLADFRILEALQDRTAARHDTVRLCRKGRVPGHSRFVSCISITMPNEVHERLKLVSDVIRKRLEKKDWESQGEPINIEEGGSPTCKLKLSHKAQKRSCIARPDSCLIVNGATFPFLVVEVANTETETSIQKKIHRWLQGSRLHVKLIVILRVREPNTNLRVIADVIKQRVTPSPIPGGNPENFVIGPNYLVKEAEIYPTKSKETFEVYLEDVLPKYWERGPATANKKAVIRLGKFCSAAKQAALHIQKQAQHRAAAGGSSPYHPNQEAISSPAGSVHGTSDDGNEADTEMADVDDGDGDFQPDDSESDDEPYMMDSSGARKMV
ncbi:MAG: hypothetical protein Q9177_002320 [Variospora cf. flavescens]